MTGGEGSGNGSFGGMKGVLAGSSKDGGVGFGKVGGGTMEAGGAHSVAVNQRSGVLAHSK